MPNYEEIIQVSQENVRSLSEKLIELDKLYQDIRKLTELPETFDEKFQQIVKLSQKFTTTIGVATKEYLDGNNFMFTANLAELDKKIKSFQDEIKRLENIDIEKDFEKLQKTLSDIFGSINTINLILSGITQTLTGLHQSIGSLQELIDNRYGETKLQISILKDETSLQFKNQDKEVKSIVRLFENKHKLLEDQNEQLKKEIKMNKIILISGFAFNLLLLLYMVIR